MFQTLPHAQLDTIFLHTDVATPIYFELEDTGVVLRTNFGDWFLGFSGSTTEMSTYKRAFGTPTRTPVDIPTQIYFSLNSSRFYRGGKHII